MKAIIFDCLAHLSRAARSLVLKRMIESEIRYLATMTVTGLSITRTMDEGKGNQLEITVQFVPALSPEGLISDDSNLNPMAGDTQEEGRW